ncbi:MAG: adenosylmethionine--8-amino-7-oxononanoate transaminase [Cytophagales bacterium]|nr:MAG: adenosylmethionine--8-amino-7-oxononanoate transaminase [Cytophagales bacterium]TAF61676.1 MAG: adenosylmethionine--8-amino-7-oxononanoate transaminase [Cytophagales bacterium]
MLERDQQYVWHPFTPQMRGYEAIPIRSAKGVWLYPYEGEPIIDAISSWWVNLHGHANPILNEALSKQAIDLEHVIFAGFTHAPAVNLAEKILKLFGLPQGKAFFSDNGSTAVEVALKIALQYFYNRDQPRLKIIAFEGAYHGDTFGAMSVGDRNPFNQPFFELLFEVQFLELPTADNHLAVYEKMQAYLSTNDVAAFIFEPLVQGAAGMRMYGAEYLEVLMQMAKKSGAFCIADEVMTGFGRTGAHFASHHLTTQPDLVCLSKGLTGGYMPLGLTLVSEPIYAFFRNQDFLKTFFHGHSFTANPLACAVALASLELLLQPQTQQAITRITSQNQHFAQEIASHKRVREVRTQGTILAIELQNQHQTSYFNEERQDLYRYFLNKGVLLRPLGNVIYTIPPYCTSADELEKVFRTIRHYLDA